MIKSKLVLANYDARILKIDIKPKNKHTKVIIENFERRKEIYLLEGHYNYDENDEYDMLNSFDVMGTYAKEKDCYHAYIQNVDAGVYMIVAKELQIVR